MLWTCTAFVEYLDTVAFHWRMLPSWCSHGFSLERLLLRVTVSFTCVCKGASVAERHEDGQ